MEIVLLIVGVIVVLPLVLIFNGAIDPKTPIDNDPDIPTHD